MNSLPDLDRRGFLKLGAGGLAASAFLAGCGTAASSLAANQSAGGQPVTLYVFRGEQGIVGPDGKNHDAFVPSSFVVKAGIPVQLTVINNDEGPHTITAPGLNLNIIVNPGTVQGDDVLPVTTTATFTAAKAGVYRWSCAMTCDGGGANWDMTQGFGGPSQDGFMAGNIMVV